MKEGGVWDYAACVLMSVVPVITHLIHHAVGIFSVDGMGLLAVALCLGILLGWVVRRSKSWLRNLVLALLTIAFVDLQFNLEDVIGFQYVLGAAFVPAWVFRQHYTRIATTSVGAILLSVPLGPPSLAVRSWRAPAQAVRRPDTSLVPIVHIVLDGHAAPRAFPADIPAAVAARDRILAFYQRHGFRLYEKAYSRFFWTHMSIPATLSPLPPSSVVDTMVDRKGEEYTAKDSRLFSWASRQGYRIHVVQSSHLDFCARNRALITSCRTYPANSLLSLTLLPVSAARRILLESRFFLFTESYLVGTSQDAFRRRQLAKPESNDPVTSLAGWAPGRAHTGIALRELALMRDRLRTELQGSWFFAHFMLPHDPYEMDKDCRVRVALSERLTRGWMDELRGNTPASRRARWALYGGQVQCLYAHLESLIQTIDSVAPPQGVLILLHGDHGSRISLMTGAPGSSSSLSDQDALDGFATLLAVRGPGVRPGLDTAAVATQELVAKLITGDSLAEPVKREPVPVVTLVWHGSKGRPAIWLPAPALAR
jgi:hypothetical protein